MSNPNLQQIPARHKELGPMIRSIFIPEENCKWGSRICC
jgi:DNA polymerase I-like protein with 3'-5' exonuclease and polymerase domains